MKRAARRDCSKRDRGAGPFVTLRHLSLATGPVIWRARDHRKGLGASLSQRPFWQSRAFNLLIGGGFALGSLLFALGAAMSLAPALAGALSLAQDQINPIFFIGSLFFTCAAYLQLFQAANAAPHGKLTEPPRFRTLIGWRPRDPGWLASATQFAGTLLFNANTFDAWFGGGGRWLRQDLLIWGPDIVGSALFLVSGYLALVEAMHCWWSWQSRSLAWWIGMVNFLGCAAFMISAVLAFVSPTGPSATAISLSTAFTLLGSFGFLIGALLSVPESAAAQS